LGVFWVCLGKFFVCFECVKGVFWVWFGYVWVCFLCVLSVLRVCFGCVLGMFGVFCVFWVC